MVKVNNQLHGLRHRQKIVIPSRDSKGRPVDREYRADTKSDPNWVLVLDPMSGDPVGRQRKQSDCRVFGQSMFNPDYEGRESYACEYYDAERGWMGWNDQAPPGEILRMLKRALA
jgi:hypothetical protein